MSAFIATYAVDRPGAENKVLRLPVAVASPDKVWKVSVCFPCIGMQAESIPRSVKSRRFVASGGDGCVLDQSATSMFESVIGYHKLCESGRTLCCSA